MNLHLYLRAICQPFEKGVYRRHRAKGMFFFVFGVICGIVLVQEVPSVPKLKPYFKNLWVKLNGSPPVSDNPSEDPPSNDSSSKND